jgi:hypothetical protein
MRQQHPCRFRPHCKMPVTVGFLAAPWLAFTVAAKILQGRSSYMRCAGRGVGGWGYEPAISSAGGSAGGGLSQQ